MVSASNDWTARLCDIRKLSSSTAASSNSKGATLRLLASQKSLQVVSPGAACTVNGAAAGLFAKLSTSRCTPEHPSSCRVSSLCRFRAMRATEVASPPGAVIPSLGCKPAGKEAAGGPLELARIEHPKVVNSAFFSPVTGRKLMTTCIDNRLRIWDYLLSVNGEPDRQIVHSHDFNRYLSPFRAEWDPKDPDERLIVIGRYRLSSM